MYERRLPDHATEEDRKWVATTRLADLHKGLNVDHVMKKANAEFARRVTNRHDMRTESPRDIALRLVDDMGLEYEALLKRNPWLALPMANLGFSANLHTVYLMLDSLKKDVIRRDESTHELTYGRTVKIIRAVRKAKESHRLGIDLGAVIEESLGSNRVYDDMILARKFRNFLVSGGVVGTLTSVPFLLSGGTPMPVGWILLGVAVAYLSAGMAKNQKARKLSDRFDGSSWLD